MKPPWTNKMLAAFIFIISPAILFSQPNKRQRQNFPGQRPIANNNGANNFSPDELKKATDNFWKVNAEFDSTDFQYAILLNDNAGLFAARQHGEGKANFLKMVGHVGAVLNNSNLGDEENAKLNLQIGQTCYALGRFTIAGNRLLDAKNRFERSSATNSYSYLETLSSLGLLYTSMGRPKKADSFLLRSTAIRENKLGVKDPGLASLYNNKAVLDFVTGRYNRAEAGFDKAVKLLQSNNQLSAMPYAIILNNESMLLQTLGRYDEAKENLLKAIDISSKLEASRARTHLKFYTNLALLYQRMSLFDDAEKTYHLLQNKYQNGTTEFANVLNNLAILLWIKGKDERVEDMLKNSSLMFKGNLGENNIAFAKAINDLGNYYRFKGRYDEATQYLEQALQIRKKFMGPRHPVFVQNEEDLAILYWKKKEWLKAMQFYHIVMDKTLDFINTYFKAMSETEKSRYWDVLSPRFLRVYNFIIEAGPIDSRNITEMFRLRAATKGLLLSSARRIADNILNSGDQQLINDYTDWIDLKEQLASFYAYSNEELRDQNINIDSLEEVANSLEKKLSFSSKEFSKFYFARKTNVFDIRTALKPNEALIEIIRLQYYDQSFTDSCRYIGLVITKNNPLPKLVILPNGLTLESDLSKTYQQAIKRKTVDERSYNYFWEPFDATVNDKKKIFISPDGVYNQINLNTIKKPGSDYLIKQYEFVLLGNPKDVLPDSNKIQKDIGKNATLIGYPDFGSEKIPELPGTRIEMDSVDHVLKSSGYKVSEFIQKNATETNLKQAKKVTVLHIATHGYFLQDVIKTYWPTGVAEENAKNNVLLRSGLLFAGAADADKLKTGLDSANNGVMTSYEAMNLDLSGTHLVVLSACETGLGEIRAGEGVYGLQRAFLAAGAEALIMSLWKVDDAATQQLMNYFYHNWITTGDKQKAFRQAQLQLMEKYPSPYYWGAFVMMED